MIIFFLCLNLINSGKFAIITDIHYDPSYVIGSNKDCNSIAGLCCRGEVLPVDDPRRAGKYGEYNCHPPLTLFEESIKFVDSLSDIDFLIFLGDVIPHNEWEQSKEYILNLMSNMTEQLSKIKNMPVIPVIGNHDTYPVDQFYMGSDQSWEYEPLLKMWTKFLPKDQNDIILKGMYFSISPIPGLRILSLNNMYCDTFNMALEVYHGLDFAGQLKWIENEIKLAKKNNEIIYFVPHIPPGPNNALGDPMCDYNYSILEVNFMKNNPDIVKGIISAHTHSDEFKVIYGNGNESFGTVFIAPALTTEGHRNPRIRIFEFDDNSFDIKNWYQYYFDLENSNKQNKPIWGIDYDFLEAYKQWGFTDLSPQTFVKQRELFHSNEDFRNFFCEKYHPLSGCDKTKLLWLYCSFQVTTLKSFQKCMGM